MQETQTERHAQLYKEQFDQHQVMSNTVFAHRTHCLFCKTELDCVQKGRRTDLELENQKFFHACSRTDGVRFTSTGNYGSRVLDCGGQIYFVICDECLVKNSQEIYYYPHPREIKEGYFTANWQKFSHVLYENFHSSVLRYPTDSFFQKILKILKKLQ